MAWQTHDLFRSHASLARRAAGGVHRWTVPGACESRPTASKSSRYLLLSTVVVAGLLGACGGEPTARPSSMGMGGATSLRPGLGTGESCTAGDVQECKITVQQESGVVSCIFGMQECLVESWGPCRPFDADESSANDEGK